MRQHAVVTETTTAIEPTVALVVDDRESGRYLLTSWLDRAGFAVVTAASGAEAIDRLHEEHIDIAVVDVYLPDMTGFELCEAIRRHPPTQALPVVHVSAIAVSTADRSEGLLRGADAYLVEPVEPREFLATVTSLIRSSRFRRREADTSVRLRSLNAATAAVHGASSESRVVQALVEGASAIVDDEAVVLTRFSGRGLLWSAPSGHVTSHPLPADVTADAFAPTETGANTVTIDDPRMVSRPYAGAPFIDDTGDAAGIILVPAEHSQRHTEVLPLLAQLAIATSLALANIRALDLEHRIAVALQQSFLPQHPPRLEGVGIAFRYIAASQHAEVGGDFYESFALDEHRALIAIGDVVGHSLRAATVMGEIRHALRAYAVDGYSPPDVVTRLDGLVRRFHPDMYTSLICGVLDTAERTFSYCSAGHLPVVLTSHGAGTVLPVRGSLLGTGRPAAEPITVPLLAGDRVFLFTDGLIERRRESIDIGLERVREIAERAVDEPLDSAVDRLVDAVAPELPDDDIAIIAAELHR